ncbi:unnamed protein product [Victoria cruziana]
MTRLPPANIEAPRSLLISTLRALCNQERLKEAIATLDILNRRAERVPPRILSSLLDLAAESRSAEHVFRVHSQIVANCPASYILLSTKLINAYGKCGSVLYARKVFDEIPRRDVRSYNAMLHGYSRNCLFDDVLLLFQHMVMEGTDLRADGFTYPRVLKAVGALSKVCEGKTIHAMLIRSGFASRLTMQNALISMYSRCSSLNDARQVFSEMQQRDVVSWNSMIAGYEHNSLWNEAFSFFLYMLSEGVAPDSVTIVSVLAACTALGDLKKGMWVHDYLSSHGFPDDDILVRNSLIALYTKCKHMVLADEVFRKTRERDVFTWTSMISGYAQAGADEEALMFFQQMHVAGIRPNKVTFTSVLPICARLAAHKVGKVIHGMMIKLVSGFDDFVACSLLDMYCKCGNLSDARQLFEEIPKRAVVSWNAMINGYGMHGYGKEASIVFEGMESFGIRPDHVTFVALLSACSHSGMIEAGMHYFDTIMDKYQVPRKTEHYASIVDLLGRAGRLDDAWQIIKRMPIPVDADVWGALLGACKIHGNIELGEYAAKKLFELKPKKAGYYMLLSNLYRESGKQDDVAKLKLLMREKGVAKDSAYSRIEMGKDVHVFVACGKDHPELNHICGIIKCLEEHAEGEEESNSKSLENRTSS